jgi:hypothetical protein
MDNGVFEILLAIYIIFTFIGGILKKKKKNDAENAAANRSDITVEAASTSKPQNDVARDFFSEMLGLETAPRQDEYTDYNEDEESEDHDFIELRNNEESPTWNPESEFNDSEFEQNSVPPVDNLASEYVPGKKKSEFQSPEQNDYHLSENESSYFIHEYSESGLIEKLRNPSSLRDAILLSEIIARPKALRKNG